MARKLAKNVTVGMVTYGPDYPDNQLTSEARKEIEDLNVWEGDDEPETALSRMNKAELQAKATKMGIADSEDDTKDDLRHKIEAVQGQ